MSRDAIISIAAFVFVALIVTVVVMVTSSIDRQFQLARERCVAAGGQPVNEYRQEPSCWSADGRRIFP